MLGPGHGPLLREDVAAAAIRPTLQGEETSQMTSVQPDSQPPDVEMTASKCGSDAEEMMQKLQKK